MAWSNVLSSRKPNRQQSDGLAARLERYSET